MPSTLPALDHRTPGASLHPLLRGQAVGVARVKYPEGARFDDSPSPEVLRRVSAGLRGLDVNRDKHCPPGEP
jgi:hypothetical protein